MNSPKFLVTLICFGILIVPACYPSTTPTLINKVVTPTEQAILITPTSRPISVATTMVPHQNCVKDIGQYPKPLTNQGKIVLSGYLNFSGASFNAPSYLLDVQSREKIMLPQDENKIIISTSFAISPDREWLAYAQVSLDVKTPDTILQVVDANGVERNSLKTNIDQRGTLWIDDTHLLTENLRENWLLSQPKAGLLLINPFTGEINELPNDYPNQWNGDNLNWKFTLSRVIYNPSLTAAIYPTFVEPNRVMRLIDTQTKEILVDVPTKDYGKFPAWSPDGKQIAFATQTNKLRDWASYQDEIFTLTEDGELVQLTNFSNDNGYSYITGLSWTTDGKKMAIWINNTDWEKGHTGVHLAVLDITTGNIREYCDIQNSDGQTYIPDTGNPIWSPDNQYLLFNLINPKDDKHILVVIVDVSTGAIFLVSENYRGIGWLK